MRKWLRRYRGAIAWVTMIVVVSFLFWNQTKIVDEVRSQDEAGRLVSCRIINHDRRLLRQQAIADGEILIASSPPEPGEDLVAREEQIAAFRQRILDGTAPLAKPIPCNEFVKNPEQYLQENPTPP